MHLFTDYILLGMSFVFNFFIPGYVVTELLIRKTKLIYKTPLYFLFSVLSSTGLLYISSLFIGFSTTTIIINYVLWTLLFLGVLFVNKFEIVLFDSEHKNIYLLFFVTILVFILSLYKSIFYEYQGYYVMSADNWQDTALHFSIMESIKEGNFPPESPYYSGHNLDYHYFTDFHSAIMAMPLDKFTPRIFVVDNSILSGIFVFSIYSLTFYITQSKRTSIMAAILSVFSGSLLSLKFLADILKGGNFAEMLSSGSYVLEYGKLFQLAPMTNYFLQNRPMMVGMSVFAISLYLLMSAVKEHDRLKMLMVLALSVLAFKFQMVVSIMIFMISAVLLFIQKKRVVLFVFPILFIYAMFSDEFKLLLSNFNYGPWVSDKDFYWFIKFFVLNLGVPFMLFVEFVVLIISKRIKTTREIVILIVLSLVMIFTPLMVNFTIDKADMLKFVYVSYIPISILAAIVLDRISSKKYGLTLVTLIIFVSISVGLIDLAGSFVNKNFGYSKPELQVGLWIRDNTPQKSIFVTNPTIHSPVSDIAGRLRVLSYINWPYTHGYGNEADNVYSRKIDIANLYVNADSADTVSNILKKYDATYVYVGSGERSDFPEAENKLESNLILQKIYDETDIKIFKSIK